MGQSPRSISQAENGAGTRIVRRTEISIEQEFCCLEFTSATFAGVCPTCGSTFEGNAMNGQPQSTPASKAATQSPTETKDLTKLPRAAAGTGLQSAAFQIAQKRKEKHS